METDPETALKDAVKEAGGLSAVAEALGITKQAVSQWKIAPANRALDLERLCKAKITRYQLRPDVFTRAAA